MIDKIRSSHVTAYLGINLGAAQRQSASRNPSIISSSPIDTARFRHQIQTSKIISLTVEQPVSEHVSVRF